MLLSALYVFYLIPPQHYEVDSYNCYPHFEKEDTKAQTH